MTLAVSGMETQTHLLSLYYLMLLVIENVRYAIEISIRISFFTLRNPQCEKIIMIYNILEFHIPNTYVRVTIHLGSKRNVVIRPNSYVKIYGLERTIKILHVITRLSPALTCIC